MRPWIAMGTVGGGKWTVHGSLWAVHRPPVVSRVARCPSPEPRKTPNGSVRDTAERPWPLVALPQPARNTPPLGPQTAEYAARFLLVWGGRLSGSLRPLESARPVSLEPAHAATQGCMLSPRTLSNLSPPTSVKHLDSVSPRPASGSVAVALALQPAPGSTAVQARVVEDPLACCCWAKPPAMDHNTLLNIVIFARGCQSAQALPPSPFSTAD